MFSKIICVFAMLCVVNASVITVNVFDDDPETEGPTRAGCTFLACDHYCRGRYGYVGAGGRCINGHCKCDYFRNTNDEVSETVSNPEEPATPGNCNLQACDQQCHQLKFPGGACVNNHCKCDNSLRTEEYPSARNCDYRSCNHRCQKFGYNGGVCVNGRCKCNQDGVSVTPTPATLSESSESQSQQDCNFRACDQLCRRLGFTSGVCVNGRCKCDNFLYAEDVLSVLPETILQRGCNFRACARHCRNLGFPGGACVDGRCKCDNFSYTTETTPVNDIPRVEDEDSNLIMKADEDELILPASRACNTVNCNDLCHRLNYAGGMCKNGVCQCY